MKRLFLLFFSCILSVNLFAQSHETSFGLNDTTMLNLPHVTLFKLFEPISFHSLNIPADTGFFMQKRFAYKQLKPMPVYPRIIVLRPLRVLIRQKCVKYGSQIIFLEPPQVIIYQAQIVCK